MSRFENSLALVTGGSQGLGKEIAKVLVSAGAHTVVLSRSCEKLRAARRELEELRQTPSQKIVGEIVDVTREAQVQEVLGNALVEHGAPDYVINCAGPGQAANAERFDARQFRGMMELNYFGTVHVCRAVVPLMADAGKGHLVNASSMGEFIGPFGYPEHWASKYAVVGFSDALRRELAPRGVHVSVLCPLDARGRRSDDVDSLDCSARLAAANDPLREIIARATLDALGRPGFFIVPTWDGRLAPSVSGFAPGILHQFAKKAHSPTSRPARAAPDDGAACDLVGSGQPQLTNAGAPSAKSDVTIKQGP